VNESRLGLMGRKVKEKTLREWSVGNEKNALGAMK
jgi:hypothetical protein